MTSQTQTLTHPADQEVAHPQGEGKEGGGEEEGEEEEGGGQGEGQGLKKGDHVT